MIELKFCPVCKSSNNLTIYAKKQCNFDNNPSNPETLASNAILKYLIQRDHITINTMRCSNCGHLFLSPTFSPDEIRKMYSSESYKLFAELKKTYENKTKQKWEQIVAGNNWDEKKKESLLKRPEIIKDVLNRYATWYRKKILDLGGASGHNLTSFKKESQLFVMDLRESEEKNEDIVYFRDYDSLSKNAPFDIIISTHTFEHIVDLDQEMKNISNILKKGSHVYIEVPCDSFSIIAKKKPRNIYPHINFFTRNSLENLFLLNGFKTKFLSLQLMPYNEQRVFAYIALFEYVDNKMRHLKRNTFFNFVKDGLFIVKNKYFNKNKTITYKLNR